jgi:hypothetical protein
MAEIAKGASCTFSSRFCAVTTISSRFDALVVLVWATAAAGNAKPTLSIANADDVCKNCSLIKPSQGEHDSILTSNRLHKKTYITDMRQ